MVTWTTDQQHAIEARGSNILVSAAAGSGKTAVLVERAVRLITDEADGTDADRLLVVTFTNAAAAEMKSRLSQSLADIIRKHPNNSNALRQLSLLPNAKICTIDSFCMNLVRENFFELDIAQDFTVLDTSQQQLIEQSAIDSIVERLYEEENSDFRALMELLSSPKNDADLIRAVKRIDRYLSAQPFPFDWLEEMATLYDPAVPFDKSVTCLELLGEVERRLDYCDSLIADTLRNLDSDDEMFGAYSVLLTEDSAVLKQLRRSSEKGWNALMKAIGDAAFSRMPRAPKGYASAQKDVLMANRAVYKDVVQKELPALVCVSEEDIHKDNERLYPLFRALIALVHEYSDTMLAMKKEINAYSFSDIEHFAIELLLKKDGDGTVVRTPLAESLAADFDYILVDEYQDTNALQDLLFRMLSNGKNRFMVGDVKQSIYRFRLAMPQIFTDKKDRYTLYDENSSETRQKIILDQNFRSRGGICDFTNFVFSLLMSREVGELAYGREEYLNQGTPYPPTEIPSARLCLVETPVGEDKDEYEARLLAAEIVRKVSQKEQIKEKEGTRNLRFGDIAVLFRSSKTKMPVYAKVFAQYGIPTVSNNRVNLFDNNEVAILVSLLRVIDNPIQDVPLLATLMSVFYGYTADDIAYARVHYKTPNLYGSVCADGERFADFLADLKRYRQYASSMNVESFIRQILSDTSYLSVIAAMGNHEQRRLNVMKLVELAKRFDKGENVGLTAFIRYIDAVTEAKLEVESADIAAGGDDCVTLMSIHKSKGLEYPVVFLAGAAGKYNYDDLKAAVLLNNKLGVGLKVNNEELLYRYNSIQYASIRNKNKYELMSENLRVLYVAVTRAKEQFIAYASYKDVERHIDSMAQKIIGNTIPSYAVKNVQCDGDLLLLCALLHEDGAALRKLTDKQIFPIASSFRFDVQLADSYTAAEEPVIVVAEADSSLVAAIRDKLSFTYQRSALSGYAAKRTASSLDEKEQSYRFFAKTKPAFLTGDTMTGAERGTAMHTFMEHCDFEKAKADLNGEVAALTKAGLLSERQASSLNREKLCAFFDSALASRILHADTLFREMKISSFVPLNELEETEFTEPVLVQGIADCVFEEDGALVLVDYKTDNVKTDEELLALYQRQITFYREAVSRTLGKPVKEAMLYSFALSRPCLYK